MNAEKTIAMLTLEEKAALLQGWSTWTTWDGRKLGIPPIFLSDGPHGLRKQAGAGDHLGLNASVPATCFPTAATMANSWDTELGEELGRALGEETAANDVHVVLGPGLNMKRSPLCGRNFEYFSEDPYLAGKMGAAYVRAIAEKCAAGSIVLLDNDGVLPLNRNDTVALIGDFAQNPRYQGAGSSVVNPTHLDNRYLLRVFFYCRNSSIAVE